MTPDVEQRLRSYRTRLDDAIADDLAGRDAPPRPRPSKRRSLVGAAAVAIVAVGVGAIAWTATNSSDNSQQSEVPATTTPLEAEPPPITETSTASTPLNNTAPGNVAPRRIALGSSVMLGAAEDLVELGFVVDATESRQFRDVVDLTASLAATGTVGDVVVIHAATNGTIHPDDLDEVTSNLADVDNIYLITDALQQPWVEPSNESMRTLAANNPNVTVIDWATAASSCLGDCFYPDNIHLRPDGQRYYAQLVHEATSEAASWTVEPGTVDPSSTSFTATVTRTGCSGGQTGTVYPPTLDMSDTSIVVTFRVAPLDPRFDYTCPSNDAVAATVTLPEPIGQRQLVDGVCAESQGAACEFGTIRWDPDLSFNPPAATSDTILPPPLTVAEPADVPFVEMEVIGNNISNRRTVALERADDGTVLWWMTVWTGITPSGVEVYCTGTLSGGQSCVPDRNVELRYPVQVNGFSTEAPSALTLIAERDVASLRASIDDAEPVDLELADVGVASGKKVAGLYLGDNRNTVRFDATLDDGSRYTFDIKAPNVQQEPSAASAGSAPLDQPYAPKELLGE